MDKDKGIVKGLECCEKLNNKCDECPYRETGCQYELSKDALDLINRQQAELEKYIRKSTIHEKTVELVTAQLKTANEVVDKIEAENNSLRKEVKRLLQKLQQPPIEAIKEFIEKCVMEFGCGRGDDRAECYISDADFLEVMERMYVGGDD